ncbi:MAG: IS1634 family transposase [Candidatus Odinarchaeota archaeon]|nr:IS1634 family transposase [Candidatus Odinarchaeota archaeon]
MSIKLKHVYQLNFLPVAYELLTSLGFPQIVEQYAPTPQKQEISNGLTLTAVVLNRLHAATPLYKIDSWAEDSGLQFLLPIDPKKLNDDRIGRTFDAIAEHIQDIFMDFSFNLVCKYNLDISELHGDGTSLYFEGEYDDQDFITKGYSHDGHSGKVQVHPFLITSADGSIPLYYSLHPGNALDHKILPSSLDKFTEKYKQKVKARNFKRKAKDKNFLFIGDRGTISKKNAIKMHNRGLKFLGPLKLDNPLKKILYGIPESQFRESSYKSKKGATYFVAEVPVSIKVGEKHVTLRGIAVISEQKRKNDIAALERAINRVQCGLTSIKAKLGRRGYKTVEGIQKRINELFSKRYKKYREIFSINVVRREDGSLDLYWSLNEDKIKEIRERAGRYLLVTNDEERTADELLAAYKNRAKSIEWVFCNLKSDLRVRPLYLKNIDRIAVLVFVTVVAAILMLLIRRQYDIPGRKERYWRRFKSVFKDVAVVVMEAGGGEVVATPEYDTTQLAIFEALKIKPPPL